MTTAAAAALAHSHVAELTYADNMPWLSAIARTVGGHLRDGLPVTDRMLDLALVGAERDHRAADTGRDLAAEAPRLDRAPARTRRRGAPAATPTAETVRGVVRYRGRKRGALRVQIDVDGRALYLTWPADADTARPGDTVEVTGRIGDTGSITRVTAARRVARPHQQ